MIRSFLVLAPCAFNYAHSINQIQENKKSKAEIHTECSLNIVFFRKIKIYSGLWPLSVFPRCVHWTWSIKWLHQSAAAELAELRKITTF